MKVTLLDMSKPTCNGRIYPSHAVEQAIMKTNWALPVVWSGSNEVSDNTLIGFATDLFVEGKTLTANISPYNNANGALLKQLIENGNHISYFIAGVAHTTTDSEGHQIVGDDFELRHVSVDVETQPLQIEKE